MIFNIYHQVIFILTIYFSIASLDISERSLAPRTIDISQPFIAIFEQKKWFKHLDYNEWPHWELYHKYKLILIFICTFIIIMNHYYKMITEVKFEQELGFFR